MARKQNACHRLARLLQSRAPLLSYGELILRPLARDAHAEASRRESRVPGDRLFEGRA